MVGGRRRRLRGGQWGAHSGGGRQDERRGWFRGRRHGGEAGGLSPNAIVSRPTPTAPFGMNRWPAPPGHGANPMASWAPDRSDPCPSSSSVMAPSGAAPSCPLDWPPPPTPTAISAGSKWCSTPSPSASCWGPSPASNLANSGCAVGAASGGNHPWRREPAHPAERKQRPLPDLAGDGAGPIRSVSL